MARKIDHLIIHCADTPNGLSMFEGKAGTPNFKTPIQRIDEWHLQRGFKRNMQWRARLNQRLEAVGYHYVIYVDGAVATGRHLDEIGAHTQGYNAASIGICLIGKDKFSPAQWNSLEKLVNTLRAEYAGVIVAGHREFNKAKLCPGFDVAVWMANNRRPLDMHIWRGE